MLRSITLITLFSIATAGIQAQCVIGNSVAPQTENGTNLVGQSFTATCSGVLEYVEFFVASSGTNTGGTLKIYSGSTVLNTPIYTQAYPPTALTSGDAFRVYLDNPIPISASNVRTFEVTMSLDVSYATNNPYSGGRFFYNGTNSSVFDQIDMKFNASIALNCAHTSSSIMADACQEYISPSGQSWLSSGIYMDTIPNVAGCDSVMTIDLTVTTLDTMVTQNGMQLTVGEAGAAYQWLDCDNGNAPVPGAVQQSFTPTSSGNYAVAVTANGCTVTSACQFVGTTGISSNITRTLRVWPNPSNGVLQVEGLGSNDGIAVFDLLGHPVPFTRSLGRIELEVAAPGMYFLKCGVEGTEQVIRFLIK